MEILKLSQLAEILNKTKSELAYIQLKYAAQKDLGSYFSIIAIFCLVSMYVNIIFMDLVKYIDFIRCNRKIKSHLNIKRNFKVSSKISRYRTNAVYPTFDRKPKQEKDFNDILLKTEFDLVESLAHKSKF